MLFPQQNKHRTVFDLNGFWRFLPDLHDAGETERWFSAPLPDHAMLIAVPGAWNEQLAERGLMNYVGKAWYETTFSLPHSGPLDRRTFLRIGAANHAARVWLNGICIGGHEGGYLPFELDMTEGVIPGALNRLTVSVDSALTMDTLPQDI
ncbi:MAG: beta-D-glucuronidase, partial [Bacteroidetes bacterium]|nr:beta-D-glucuronidase [Bacteroidota bacterium]